MTQDFWMKYNSISVCQLCVSIAKVEYRFDGESETIPNALKFEL